MLAFPRPNLDFFQLTSERSDASQQLRFSDVTRVWTAGLVQTIQIFITFCSFCKKWLECQKNDTADTSDRKHICLINLLQWQDDEVGLAAGVRAWRVEWGSRTGSKWGRGVWLPGAGRYLSGTATAARKARLTFCSVSGRFPCPLIMFSLIYAIFSGFQFSATRVPCLEQYVTGWAQCCVSLANAACCIFIITTEG